MSKLTYEEFKTYMDQYNAELAAAEPSAWSAGARTWAENNGLTKGGENGTFRCHLLPLISSAWRRRKPI